MRIKTPHLLLALLTAGISAFETHQYVTHGHVAYLIGAFTLAVCVPVNLLNGVQR